MFDWMVWTTPVAVFFIAVLLLLVGMTFWEIKSPSVLRRGFLPMSTTRGDRLFIGLLAAAYINLAFVGLGEKLMMWFDLAHEPSVWISFIFSVLFLIVVMRRG